MMLVHGFLNGAMGVAGALAIFAIVATVLGLMLGILKPADAFMRIAFVAGVILLLSIVPSLFVSAWRNLTLWQKLGVATLAVAVWLRLRPRFKTCHKRREQPSAAARGTREWPLLIETISILHFCRAAATGKQ